MKINIGIKITKKYLKIKNYCSIVLENLTSNETANFGRVELSERTCKIIKKYLKVNYFCFIVLELLTSNEAANFGRVELSERTCNIKKNP